MMYRKIGKITLIVGVLCLVFIVTIGLITDKQKINDEVNAQEGRLDISEVNNKDNDNEDNKKDDDKEVTEPIVKELKVSKDNIVLSVGESYKLSVEGLLSDANQIDLTNDDKLIYGTDNEEIITISEDGNMVVSEEAKTGNKAVVMCTYEGLSVDIHISVKQSLEDTVRVDKDGKKIVTNYLDTDVLVNKKRNLPSDYIPKDLVKPDVPFSFKGENEKRYLRKVASDALEELFEEAYTNEIKLFGVSGYRSYKRQEIIFNYKVKTRGFEAASKVSAQPGQSEHQTGLAIDVSCAKIKFKLQEKLGELKEGIWLQENAHKFGFIIRYPLGKEDITGYQYEPWHIRYVGKEIAKDIYEKDITYEEYMELR